MIPTAITIPTLVQLVAITGGRADPERLGAILHQRAQSNDEPLAQLVSVAPDAGFRVTPIRQKLSEALWHAREDMPLALWCARESRWVVVTYAGWFKVRVTDGDHPTHRVSLSRRELVDLLGLNGPDEMVEAGLAQPLSIAASASIPGDAGHGHGHGDHDSVSPTRRFMRLLKGERQEIVTLLIFSVMSGVLYLAAPLAVDSVVSNLAFGGQSQPYVQAIIVLAIALFGALGLQALVSGFQYYLSDIIQRRIFVRTASDLAYRLPRVRADALEGVHAPELVNRFFDVVTAQKSTSMLLLDGINLIFGSLIGMLLLALYHPLMLLFVVVLLALIVLCLWLLGKGAVSTSIAESRVKYDLVNWFEQVAAFPFAFKGPGGYKLASERSDHFASKYVRCRAAHFRVVMRQIVALLILSVAAAAILLVLGGWLVVSQQITLGQLVASELIMSSIVAAMAKMGKKLEAWYDAMAAMDKLGHIFDLETERAGGEKGVISAEGAEIRASGVSFGYHEPLFEDKSFVILPSSRVAIVGPHGSGASSLLDILFGLRTPTAGHVSVDGLDLRSWHLESLRERVMLLRRDDIVDGTVVDNLRMGRDDVGLDEIRDALDKVGLLDVLLRRPEGMNQHLTVGGAPLSGNQRTRLLLARAIVQNPRLLMIDELFDSLDPESFSLLQTAILDPCRPWTVILATRDHDVTRVCDQIIQLAPCHLNDGTSSESEKERLNPSS